MLLNIVVALGRFQGHLISMLGQPIGLSTLVAFTEMQSSIFDAVNEEEASKNEYMYDPQQPELPF